MYSTARSFAERTRGKFKRTYPECFYLDDNFDIDKIIDLTSAEHLLKQYLQEQEWTAQQEG